MESQDISSLETMLFDSTRSYVRELGTDDEQAEGLRDICSAMARFLGRLLETDERWNRYWWVDDVLPMSARHPVLRKNPSGYELQLQGLMIWGQKDKDLIPRLGIEGLTVSGDVTPLLGDLRIPSGVVVASLVADQLAVDSGLAVGDVIHSLKGTEITSVDGLRKAFNNLKPGEAATMQVERSGQLTYVAFEME
jgi:PDZ domain